MQTLELSKSKKIRKIRSLIGKLGNQIGAVTFKKRSTGELRKMTFRLHVSDPTYASKPKGTRDVKGINDSNDQITVFDCGVMRYGKKDRINGRGDWRTIPLENVMKLTVNGEKYRFLVK